MIVVTVEAVEATLYLAIIFDDHHHLYLCQ